MILVCDSKLWLDIILASELLSAFTLGGCYKGLYMFIKAY